MTPAQIQQGNKLWEAARAQSNQLTHTHTHEPSQCCRNTQNAPETHAQALQKHKCVITKLSLVFMFTVYFLLQPKLIFVQWSWHRQ